MGNNEIRLRRHRISSGKIAQHRNYGDIMARLQRDARLKRVTHFFIYFLIAVIFILLVIAYALIRKWDKLESPKGKPATAYVVKDSKIQPVRSTGRL